jgi:hypothetical protein
LIIGCAAKVDPAAGTTPAHPCTAGQRSGDRTGGVRLRTRDRHARLAAVACDDEGDRDLRSGNREEGAGAAYSDCVSALPNLPYVVVDTNRLRARDVVEPLLEEFDRSGQRIMLPWTSTYELTKGGGNNFAASVQCERGHHRRWEKGFFWSRISMEWGCGPSPFVSGTLAE